MTNTERRAAPLSAEDAARLRVSEANNGGLGVWQANMTSDGTHPSQTTHTITLAPLVQSIATSFALPA